jgi:large subunit ribosomal protein L15
MNELSSLQAPDGSRTTRKRKGRGPGSGLGKTAGRGEKGYGSRSGSSQRPGFEGGQMPLQRRIPKGGFKNPFRTEYRVVNVEQLKRFENGTVINPEVLRASGLISGRGPIKVLGQGEIDRGLVVQAHAFSKSAVQKIEALGGKAETIDSRS